MSPRALALAILVVAAGCNTAPTAVRVSLSAPASMIADSVQLSIYDRRGRRA